MLRYSQRRDGNEKAIIEFLEKAGCSVDQLPGGNGRPDLLIGEPRYRSNMLWEIKRGTKLNQLQIDYHDEWRGTITVVESVEEARVVLAAYWKSRGDSGSRRY